VAGAAAAALWPHRLLRRVRRWIQRLEIDADRCELLDTESTVECIAEHILGLLKSREPDVAFRVRAYEGVNKGAIASG
jgi:hypothetical protein